MQQRTQRPWLTAVLVSGFVLAMGLSAYKYYVDPQPVDSFLIFLAGYLSYYFSFVSSRQSLNYDGLAGTRFGSHSDTLLEAANAVVFLFWFTASGLILSDSGQLVWGSQGANVFFALIFVVLALRPWVKRRYRRRNQSIVLGNDGVVLISHEQQKHIPRQDIVAVRELGQVEQSDLLAIDYQQDDGLETQLLDLNAWQNAPLLRQRLLQLKGS